MAAALMLRISVRLLHRPRGVYAAGVAMASSRAMASKTAVGFIGLGNMGTPMAKNLVKHGYPVIAHDVFPEACKEFQELGTQVTDSPADVAEKADRIITMLPSNPNVIEVYTGPSGILKKVKKGSLLIDSSTIDPAVSKELAKEAEKMGAVFMDAPVSGGVGAARAGNLTFMVGGVEQEFAAAKELLTCMGSNVVYCGEVGTGQAAKICNNMLLAISMIGTAETMNLGISGTRSKTQASFSSLPGEKQVRTLVPVSFEEAPLLPTIHPRRCLIFTLSIIRNLLFLLVKCFNNNSLWCCFVHHHQKRMVYWF